MFNSSLNPPALIITGMHRSGTSLTASLLQSAGVNIGQDLMQASQGNAKGYFENIEFVHFHERVLLSQGITKEGWTLQNSVSVQGIFVEQAKQLIQNNQAAPLWGWKDPRTSLFLNFWEKVIPEAKFIFIFRSPWEVIDSLYRRGNQGDEIFVANPRIALDLWINYNKIILDFYNTFSAKCVLLNLKLITESPKDFIDITNKKLELNLGKIDDLYDQTLLNQSINWHRLSLLKQHFPEVIDLYHTLNSQADVVYAEPIFDFLLSQEFNYFHTDKTWIFQDWLNARKQERTLKQTYTQLYQTQTQLEQSYIQLQHLQSELGQERLVLQQTQGELEHCRSVILQIQSELEQSQTQLQHTQSELEQSQTQLQHTQSELEQSQTQLQHTQSELEQSQTQLQHTQSELEQSQTQLQHTQSELEQSQTQLQHTQSELEQSQTQLQHTQSELEQSQLGWQETQNELQQMQRNWEITQIQLEQSQEGWEMSNRQLQQTQHDWEDTKRKLQQTQHDWEDTKRKLQQTQHDWENIQSQLKKSLQMQEKLDNKIQSMESSKFWKLRWAWFNFRHLLGFKGD